MDRPLPSPEEAVAILARRRTRPARRPPNPAGRSLNKLVKQLDERFGQGPGALQVRWREIVGETLFARTEPVRIIKPRLGGPATLELKVEGPVAALIQHQAPLILDRLNFVMGQGAVGKLRIIQGPIRRTSSAPITPAKPRPKPLDAASEQVLALSLAEQPDDRLKQNLLRLGRAVMAREQR